ncbi:UNVERIFIED_CONTAM: hypothetical protein Sangu_1018600 [Sesamum angustifolium]|uniref:4Fe-4S ferredoxin-type domain-containing protein n=1 Tax=Sesamum angustifolium TaxID=2727405 RepID=A0AAW2NXF1_9LAMI
MLSSSSCFNLVMHRFHHIMSRGFQNNCALCRGQGECSELCALAMAQTGDSLVGRAMVVIHDGELQFSFTRSKLCLLLKNLEKEP